MQKLLIVCYQKIAPQVKSGNISKYRFSPDLGGKNGGVLSMRMQVILDSSFARPGSAPIWGGKKGEFRDWTIARAVDVVMARAKRIYILIIKVFLFLVTMFSKRNRKHVLRISIELYKHS